MVSSEHTSHEKGPFDVSLETYYQSDADFELSIKLWNLFPQETVTMVGKDLQRAHELLPDVSKDNLGTIKTKCNIPCSCPHTNNALDLIEFCIRGSIHGREFLTSIFNEDRPNKKISIIDSVHKQPWLPASVVYLNDTQPIPCPFCGELVHLYLLHRSIAHYWDGRSLHYKK
jgi:hypothetical protein